MKRATQADSSVESSTEAPAPDRLTPIQWLVCAVACLGFVYNFLIFACQFVFRNPHVGIGGEPRSPAHATGGEGHGEAALFQSGCLSCDGCCLACVLATADCARVLGGETSEPIMTSTALDKATPNRKACIGAQRRPIQPTRARVRSIIHSLLLSLAGIATLLIGLDQIVTGEFRGRWLGHLTSSGQPFRFWILAIEGLACSIGVLIFAIPQLVRGVRWADGVGLTQARRFQLLKFPAGNAEEVAKEGFYAKHEEIRP